MPKLDGDAAKLHEAAQEETTLSMETIPYLVKKGIDINVTDPSYWHRTALHRAAQLGLCDIAQTLIDCKADVDVPVCGRMHALPFLTASCQDKFSGEFLGLADYCRYIEQVGIASHND